MILPILSGVAPPLPEQQISVGSEMDELGLKSKLQELMIRENWRSFNLI